jgi:hypothetical protein
MLNVVIIDNTNRAISGGYEDNMTIAYSIYVGAGKIGTMARRFPRAVFTVGADAATWSSNKYFDHYVTADVMGIAGTGRIVASGVHLFEKLGGHRYFDGDWHYVRDKVAVGAFVSNIGNDIRYGCMSQSGAWVFDKESYTDELGIISSGAADSSGRRINAHDAYGLGDSHVTDVSPDRWSSKHGGAYAPFFPAKTWRHASMADKIQINHSKCRGIISHI